MSSEELPKQKPRVLCVDDEPAIRDVLRMLLEKQGYSVETASDGLAAWERLAGNLAQFELVITDNEMPKLSGLALVQKLRAAGFPGSILLFSASVTEPSAQKLRDSGVDAMLPKGGSMIELLALVRKLTA